LKILVVDDSATMRRIIINVCMQLGQKKENISEAPDGKIGLEVFNKTSPDIVLTDWNMPIMNGLELVEEIRKISKVPIIMITTEGGKGEVITALKSGVNNYIVKPFGAPILKDKLAALGLQV